MKRKIIFTMLLICISLTACKTEKTVTNESTDAVVEEQDEESITVSENDPSIELFNANNGTATVGNEVMDYEEYMKKVKEAYENGEFEKVKGTDQELTDEILIVDEAYEQTEEAGAVEFTVTPMDTTMYAAKNCNVRKGPDASTYERVGALTQAQEVKVTGKVNEANWYEISLSDGTTGYVSATLLSETKPEISTNTQNQGNSNNSTKSAQEQIKENPGINPVTGKPWQPGDQGPTIYYDDGRVVTGKYLGNI